MEDGGTRGGTTVKIQVVYDSTHRHVYYLAQALAEEAEEAALCRTPEPPQDHHVAGIAKKLAGGGMPRIG